MGKKRDTERQRKRARDGERKKKTDREGHDAQKCHHKVWPLVPLQLPPVNEAPPVLCVFGLPVACQHTHTHCHTHTLSHTHTVTHTLTHTDTHTHTHTVTHTVTHTHSLSPSHTHGNPTDGALCLGSCLPLLLCELVRQGQGQGLGHFAPEETARLPRRLTEFK